MNMPNWFSNFAYWSAQVALLVLAAGFLPHLFKIRQPRVLLIYWRALIAVSILLPFAQPWHRPEMLYSTSSVRFGEVSSAIGSPSPVVSFWHFPSASTIAFIVGLAILFGIAARFTILALGLARLRQFRKTSSPVSSFAESTALLDQMRIRVNTGGEFRLSTDVASPVTFGLSAPVILLPERFPTLDAQYQSAIACHELIHVRRRDWAHHLSEEIVRAALWFHPAIGWLISRIRLSREQVVDLEVVRLTEARKPYLEALLEFTNSRALAAIPAPPFLVERQLAERVALMLKEVRMSRTRLIASLTAIAACLAIVATLAVWAFPLKAAQKISLPPIQNSGSRDFRIVPGGIVGGVAGGVTQGISGGVANGVPGGVSGGVVGGVTNGVPGGITGGVDAGQSGKRTIRRVPGKVAEEPIAAQNPSSKSTAPPATPADSRIIGKFQYIPPATASSGKFQNIPPVIESSPSRELIVGPGQPPPPATNQGVFQNVAPSQPGNSGNPNLQSTTGPINRDASRYAEFFDKFERNTGQNYRPGANGVTMPICQYCPKPEYSEEARSENFSGTVYLQVVVRKDGHAGEIKVIRPLGKGLDEQAINTVRDKWTFKPAVDSNGDPVDVTVPVEVSFQLYPPPSSPAPASQNPPSVPPPAATAAPSIPAPPAAPPAKATHPSDASVPPPAKIAAAAPQAPPPPPAQPSDGIQAKIFTGPVTGSSKNTPFYMGRVKMQTLYAPNPEFSDLARQANVQGTVTLNIVLNTEGKVIEVDYVKGPAMLVQSAMDAARKWIIKGTHDGVPVTFQTQIEMSFQTK